MAGNSEKSLTDIYLEGRERAERRNKIIRITVGIFLLLIIAFYTGYKLYSNMERSKRYFQNQIMNTNYILVQEFDNYLEQTGNLAMQLLFTAEIDREYQKGLLSGNREAINNLERVSRKEKYRVDDSGIFSFPSLKEFLTESSICIQQLIDEKELSVAQKEYLGEIINVYKKLRDLRVELLREYWTDSGEDQNEIYERMFYDGQYIYDYINRAYQIIDGVQASVPTSKSLEQKKRSSEYSHERIEGLKNAMSKNEAMEYASDVCKAIFGEPVKLIEKGVQSEDYDTESGTGNIYGDDSGRYLIAVQYAAESFDSDSQYINIGLVDRDFLYVNAEYKAKKKLSNVDLERIADNLVESFKCKHLKRVGTGNTYTYRVEDDHYIDQTKYVTVELYADGVLRQLSLSSPELFYGTCERKKPGINAETAIKAIEEEHRKDIEGWKLVDAGELYYQFTVREYGNRFNINVDANIGKIINVVEATN